MSNLDMLAAALKYAQLAFDVFPVYWVHEDGSCGCKNAQCEHVGKHPIPANGLKAATVDAEEIKSWWERYPQANIGTTSYLRIDIDTKEKGLENWRTLIQKNILPKTTRVRTPSGGWHLYFKQDGVEASNSRGNLPPGIDVRGEGKGYTILPPSNHQMGEYEWVNDPESCSPAAPPKWLLSLLLSVRGKGQFDLKDKYVDGGRNNAMSSVAGKIASVGMSYDEVMATVETLNKERCDPPLTDDELKTTIGRAVAGWVDKAQKELALKEQRPDLLAHPFDHAGHADTVLEFYSGKFLYSTNLGWMNWTGKYWRNDPAAVNVHAAIEEVLRARQRALAGNDITNADKKFTASKPHRSNMIGTEAFLKHKCHQLVDSFDKNPDLINVNNGVLNLHTGILNPHEQKYFMTYCLPVDYDPDASYEEWELFLGQTLKSTEVLNYVQMAIGYSLTGYTREECLFYLHGPTRAGKGTFTETLLQLFGDLATETSFDVFTGTADADRQNFALAPLRARRCVFASESSKRFPLNPAKLKQITGGNNVYCAFKHHDMFSYRPTWKLWLSSNHSVNVDVEDDAAWYRMKVIEMPFSKEGKEDKTLKAQLRQPEVLQGILAWAIEGARAWYQNPEGLVDPTDVIAAKVIHRDKLDRLGEFIEERCLAKISATDLFTSTTMLYDAYTEFCNESGYKAVGKSEFGRRLAKRGFNTTRQRENGSLKRGFTGIGVGIDESVTDVNKILI